MQLEFFMNMLTELIQLFVSVELPMELREKVAALAQELPEDSIKPVRPEDMHLTLKNIGGYTPETFKEIEQKLQTIEFSPFTVSLKGVMVLPNEDIPRIISVGVESEQNVLAEKVNEALEGIGISEFGEFPTHETIANVWKKTDLSKFLEKHKGEEFGTFEVNKFYLMQSYFDLENPRTYMVLAEFGSG
jgi:2'-5' RNA ligase